MATKTVDFVSNFIEEHALPMGVAKGVLHTEQDCENFYIGFYGRNQYVVDDLLDYRENRIENSNIDIDTFLDMCYNKGMEEAFAKTFFQHFVAVEIEKVSDAITKGKITLEQLFVDFQKNPNKNIMKNII